MRQFNRSVKRGDRMRVRGWSSKWGIPGAALALYIVVLAVYWPTLNHGFIEQYDDELFVTRNPVVQQGITPATVCWTFTAVVAANWHPLTLLSHLLDVQLYGLNPRGHHFTNIVLHATATVLLFILMWQITQTLWPSALVAALFGLHPMHIESVAWISERKDVLSACLWFLTTMAYVRYAKKPGLNRYWPVVVLFALGLMCKAMLVTLPFTLLLLDFWPLNRFPSRLLIMPPARQTLALVAEKAPLFALSCAASVATFLTQQSTGSTSDTSIVPLGFRFANAAVSYVRYVVKLIQMSDYAVFYPRAPWAVWQVLTSLAILAVVTVAVLRSARTRPSLPVGWLWYLGTLVPVIGLVPTGMFAMGDRYTYIPSVGLFIMLAWGSASLLRRFSLGKPLGIACAVLLLTTMAAVTRLNLAHWYNSETLFRHALALTENNFVANYALGTELTEQGRFDEAEPYLAEAVRLMPDEVRGHKTLGHALHAQGKLEGAYACYEKVERLDPGNGSALYTMGVILEKLGKPEEAARRHDEAIAAFRAAVAALPGDPLAAANLEVALKHARDRMKTTPNALQL